MNILTTLPARRDNFLYGELPILRGRSLGRFRNKFAMEPTGQAMAKKNTTRTGTYHKTGRDWDIVGCDEEYIWW
jgi:hypothetical protein